MRRSFRPVRTCLGACLILLVAGPAAPRLSAEVKIARGGEARARIVVALDAGETERFAAEELALFLHIVTGASFPVRADLDPPGRRLLVGLDAVRAAHPNIDLADLAPEEIVLRTAGSDLILLGGSHRGTLYAVYRQSKGRRPSKN